jgi:hypothetical protein
MLRDESARAPALAESRFHALQGEISRCVTQAVASPASPTDRGQMATWTMERAAVGLRTEIVGGFIVSAEVEISIAARW